MRKRIKHRLDQRLKLLYQG